MTTASLADLLALERNLRRAGFPVAARGLATRLLTGPEFLVRFDQGREVRILLGDADDWRAWWRRGGRDQNLLVATYTHALIDAPPRRKPGVRKATGRLNLHLDADLLARLTALAQVQRRSLTAVARDALATYLPTLVLVDTDPTPEAP